MDDRPSSPVVPDPAHRRPDGCTDATVEAMGKVGEAWEWVQRVRGRLYDFHQMIGRADLLFGEAADALESAGHVDQADRLRNEVVGRVIDGKEHVFEAEMKEQRRTPGTPGHESRPPAP